MAKIGTVQVPIEFIVSDSVAVGPMAGARSMFTKPDFRVMKNIAGGGKASEIYIYDDIGPGWLGMIDGQAVVNALQEIGNGSVTVRINSRGGDVVEGIAIYNAFRRYTKIEGNSVAVGVDSLAASSASLIAMSGDRVEMAENGSMMIHTVWSFAWGNALELRKVAKILDQYDDNVAKTYAAKTGLDVPTILDMMKAETWMNAEEAESAGFIDSIGDAADVEAPAARASWYQGREASGNGKEKPKRFGDLAAIDRSVQLKRKRLELL
jgi:ATP-dependent protease ClpP protease subunit